MYSIPSSLTSQVQDYSLTNNALSEHGFTLGGNWDYDHGSFDCALDEANKVWLRLPFDVTVGNLDSGSQESDLKIQFGQPYVLKHVYNDGLDKEAQPRAMGALMDQFSDPVDPDDEIESHWIERAKQKLNKVESMYPA
ncbi:YugN family protein [Cohnella silvisoli]|uniref:YugN family protein n=1 Tax=Cohnella silvisoli TaxID=2873699 RepID=A0ABV1L480_9BACL|nr:YugN family protein [Cohnella silvisoli]MCD9026498.1 YugN-like family protein [Cohnella silvisoli]